MKVLLINPPFQRLKGIAHTYFPLGLGYLCADLSRDNRINAMVYNAETPDLSEHLPFHVKYQDMLKLHRNYIYALQNNKHYVWKEVYRVIQEFNPDLIGLSIMTAKYSSAIEIAQIAKSINNNYKVVCGGPHPTIDPEGVLQNPGVDFVVRGEGEETLKELVDLTIQHKDTFQEKLSSVDGLSYKSDSRIYHNRERKLIENLDDLSFPARDKLFFGHRYLPSSWGDMITLRGCPFRCGYCGAHNTWHYKVRYREPLKVLEEINTVIAQYNTREFYFWDDNFTLDRERTLELCQLITQNNIRISWGCTTRVDLLDDSTVKELKQAGCTLISIGIETASPRMLTSIHKDITIEKIYSAIGLLDKYGLKYEAFFMLGFPEETEEDIEQTFSFMQRLNKAKICFSIFTPYPGTEQYEIAKRHNLIPERHDWSKFSHQSEDNFFMKNVDKEKFDKYVNKIASWIDENNTRNIEISRLVLHTYLNLGLLIRRPGLILNKFKTLLAIAGYKIKLLLKKPLQL